ncbi:FAD-binding protein, partial [Sutterella sp.]|uniref:FAD-binding protein n=1 Tax=Sutterella sp. TaxID=1981025 RepID=UPI0026DFA049
EIGMERGWAFKADTIEELAQQIGVPPANLRDTMKQVNGYAEKGEDPEFGRKPEHLEKFDLEKGPYYALKGIRAFFLTLGGVTVTPKFEAKTPQGDVIPNLYVVGQDIGGLYDSSYDLRCEGSASSFAMTSGRLAALNAIAEIEAGR